MSIKTAITALSAILGDQLSLSKPDLEAHGQSESHFAPALPDAVAYPENTAQVAEIVKICNAHDCPVIAYGAGTALEGHTLAPKGGVTLDLGKMNKLLKINAEDMDAVLQPGLTREELNTELRATGLFFPVDPGANATLGGMASTRASGTTAVRYGTMRDNVVALEVVLADGRIIRTGSRARKSSSGYDLTALFVGAEGTLGIITELTLRLHGQPEAVSSAVCAFNTITDAVNAVICTIQMGIPMARIEFIDEDTTRACNAFSGTDMAQVPHLMVEFHGSDAGVAEQAETFGEIVADMGGTGFKWSSKPEERKALWQMRHNAYYACLALRKGAVALITDVCVPISRLAEAVEASRQDIAASPLQGPILGHVGDGNYHAMFLVEPGNNAEMKLAKELSNRMVERALKMGGTATGEHGIGMGKQDYMQAEHGDGWALMGEIKQALDPKNTLNPSKVVRSQPNNP
ncbi:MAG TPA: 2-hydroxy-acid oxidase [Rhodobacteraceae bacterium]|nr:2-hydroxy-acid oxidase [Paracoccaceae bacterium]